MTFLDSNIIIDLFGSSTRTEAAWSRKAYAQAVSVGTVSCNHIVLAELVGQTELSEMVIDKLEAFQIDLVELSTQVAFAAGRAFAAYRARGGRKTILPDFLIGGHAEALGAALMTRDRRLAGYFPNLTLITPESNP